MAGAWMTRCFPSGGYHHVIEIEVHEDVWTQTDWTFGDQNCRKVLIEYQTMHQVTSTAPTVGAWNGKALLAWFRPYTQELARALNDARYCGHANWLRGRTIEVIGQSCQGYPVPAFNQMTYSIFRTEGPKHNALWIGVAGGTADGSSPQKRHVEYFREVLIRDPRS